MPLKFEGKVLCAPQKEPRSGGGSAGLQPAKQYTNRTGFSPGAPGLKRLCRDWCRRSAARDIFPRSPGSCDPGSLQCHRSSTPTTAKEAVVGDPGCAVRFVGLHAICSTADLFFDGDTISESRRGRFVIGGLKACSTQPWIHQTRAVQTADC